MKSYLDDMFKFVGLLVIALLIGGAIVAAVYFVLGSFTDQGRHWLATALVFGVAGAFALGLRIGKEHVKGVERGLSLKIGARERGKQTATPAAPAQPGTPARSPWDDLLPRPEQGAIIVSRSSNDNTPIDL